MATVFSLSTFAHVLMFKASISIVDTVHQEFWLRVDVLSPKLEEFIIWRNWCFKGPSLVLCRKSGNGTETSIKLAFYAQLGTLLGFQDSGFSHKYMQSAGTQESPLFSAHFVSDVLVLTGILKRGSNLLEKAEHLSAWWRFSPCFR